MTLEIKKNAEETTIELAGRLDTTTAPALDKTINNDINEELPATIMRKHDNVIMYCDKDSGAKLL